MDRRIWLFIWILISSFLPLGNAQYSQEPRKIWGVLSPSAFTDYADVTVTATLTIYCNYVTQLAWTPIGSLEAWQWDDTYIRIVGQPAYNTPMAPNSTIELDIILPTAIGPHSRQIIIYDWNDLNWNNYTTVTVTVLPSIPGIDFSFVLNPKDIYFDMSKTVGTPHITGQLYCTNEHDFYLSISSYTNPPNGLTISYPTHLGATSLSDPTVGIIDISFATNSTKLNNGDYAIEFDAYYILTNDTKIIVPQQVVVHVWNAHPAIISIVWISPQSPLWGEYVTIFANMTRGIEWARLHYSIDKGDNWKMTNMEASDREANLYVVVIPTQMIGTETLYYVEVSDESGNVEKYLTQTYTVGMPVWVMALAFTFVLIIAAMIIVNRKKHPPPPAPLPPTPSEPLPPPPETIRRIVEKEKPQPASPPISEQKHIKYKSQFHCKACEQSFWVSEHRFKIPYCLNCGAPDPVHIETIEQ